MNFKIMWLITVDGNITFIYFARVGDILDKWLIYHKADIYRDKQPSILTFTPTANLE